MEGQPLFRVLAAGLAARLQAPKWSLNHRQPIISERSLGLLERLGFGSRIERLSCDQGIDRR